MPICKLLLQEYYKTAVELNLGGYARCLLVAIIIEDFDGHTWEILYMDISKFPKEQPARQ
ncbi:hypothetical protein SAMN05443549_10580 [Flavobacterium fluvii]|uniref:Uncharacterized protein n=1 Tax=Flavobacterium fluvii TaxID=468056 RepID=A0A1M5L519_9FLAO|nr:hypothetical protein [Flavobacterium fluvii]SHG60108.1 hypothetical protein SAMN05443549_10580 [Flavobacterium fluvii]